MVGGGECVMLILSLVSDVWMNESLFSLLECCLLLARLGETANAFLRCGGID